MSAAHGAVPRSAGPLDQQRTPITNVDWFVRWNGFRVRSGRVDRDPTVVVMALRGEPRSMVRSQDQSPNSGAAISGS
jgi:hypothetical protein